jgi:N-acetylmuramoyl-L-alanine amidase
MKGKLAVGNVILNRVRSSAYPNTIYGVIFDRKYGTQFSPVANGTIYNTPTADSIIAAKMCLEGYSLSSDILYFVNPKKAPNSWIAQNRTYAFTVGNHAFFE